MVAKSYANLEQVGQPYLKNKKQYVKVIMKSGLVKEVRWYPETMSEKTISTEDIDYKKVLGFDNPEEKITIFRGDTNEYTDFFKLSNARYARLWGWYVIGKEEIPSPLPNGITPVALYWNQISKDNKLKSEKEITGVIDGMMYANDNPSKFQGMRGDRIQIDAKLLRVSTFETQFGTSNLFTFIDQNENQYIWTTSTKQVIHPGETYNIIGTVKDHGMYKGICQTALTRCKVIK